MRIKKYMRKLIVLMVAMLCNLSAWADFAQAHQAYMRGDYATAIKLFNREANAGDAYAQYYLGMINELGQGVSKNTTRALYWYRKAAEQKHLAAMYNLAGFYFSGIEMPQNYQRAFELYLDAAKLGLSEAQNRVGYMYHMGYYAQKNDREAFRWFLSSAKQGNRLSQNNVAYFYQHGLGVPKNLEKAYLWYMLAIFNGFDEVLEDATAISKQLTQNQLKTLRAEMDACLQNHYLTCD